MVSDQQAFQKLVQDAYEAMVEQEHGQSGIDALKAILETLHKLYTYIEPELCDAITVFRVLQDGSFPIDQEFATRVSLTSAITQMVSKSFIVQILDSGDLLIWNDCEAIPGILAQSAVVYQYRLRAEYIFAGNSSRIVPKIHPSFASEFAIPTFCDLESALHSYKAKMVKYCSCEILKSEKVWSNPDTRLEFQQKPERYMRRSLAQFLNSCFRDNVEVRPEQIVDESHPVDIKVTWMLTNRLALIEIKWLGISIGDNTETNYSASRARDGAKQLAEYLDANLVQAPTHITVGYLVVFDGRRRTNNKHYYRGEEITYTPEYHRERSDFREPIRMYMEPA